MMLNKVDKLDAQGYRKFGLVTGAIFAGLFGLLLPWIFGFNFPLWPWILFGILGGLALLIPMALGPIYIVWMKFGYVMNWINTRLILGILFYGMFVPVGLVLKLLGKVPIAKKFDNKLTTYRKECQQTTKENMENPF